jgi:hypothetical protein
MTLRLTAHNAATESENRIHSDEVARQFGFHGGLVPGVTVYGYLMRTVGELPRSAQVRLFKPVFDGDELVIRMEANLVTANRQDELCAQLTLGGFEHEFPPIPDAPLPDRDARPPATAATLTPGMVLGTLRTQLEDTEPDTLLNLANLALLDNFLLNPWLHVASEITYGGASRAGDPVAAHSRIHDRFEKKGREFVVLDVVLSQGSTLVQSIRHTAIYRLGSLAGCG